MSIWHALIGDFFVQSYVKDAALTHDPERIKSYGTDPLIKRPISARVLLGLYTTAERIIEDAQAIHIPTQLLLSRRDWVVHNKPQRDFYDRLGTKNGNSHLRRILPRHTRREGPPSSDSRGQGLYPEIFQPSFSNNITVRCR